MYIAHRQALRLIRNSIATPLKQLHDPLEVCNTLVGFALIIITFYCHTGTVLLYSRTGLEVFEIFTTLNHLIITHKLYNGQTRVELISSRS